VRGLGHFAAVVIFLTFVPGALGANYTFTPIVGPGNFRWEAAFDINNNGQIVGEYSDATALHGVRDDGGAFTTIDVPGTSDTTTSGINDAGQIVGFYDEHGFLLSGGVFTTVDSPGASLTQLWGINNVGQIVGETAEQTSFLFSGGVFTPITVPGASGGTAARSINNSGQVVGSYGNGANVHGFLLVLSSGAFTTIDFPGAFNTYLFSINNRGDIVGRYQLTEGGTSHGFRLSKGQFTTIDEPGSTNTILFGINDDGVMVGQDDGGGVLVLPTLTELGSAQVWIGLQSLHDIGVRFDLKADVVKNGVSIGAGQLDNVPGGGPGFRGARLNTIPLTLSQPVAVSPADALSITLSVRTTCAGGFKNSGTARLWYNDAAADSSFSVTIGGLTSTLHLLTGFELGVTPGSGPKTTTEASGGERCGAFTSLGTWSTTLPLP
jgi:hypothetical protein